MNDKDKEPTWSPVLDRIQDWYARNEALIPPVAALELRELLLGKSGE